MFCPWRSPRQAHTTDKPDGFPPSLSLSVKEEKRRRRLSISRHFLSSPRSSPQMETADSASASAATSPVQQHPLKLFGQTADVAGQPTQPLLAVVTAASTGLTLTTLQQPLTTALLTTVTPAPVASSAAVAASTQLPSPGSPHCSSTTQPPGERGRYAAATTVSPL